jgi:hypothetical protein
VAILAARTETHFPVTDLRASARGWPKVAAHLLLRSRPTATRWQNLHQNASRSRWSLDATARSSNSLAANRNSHRGSDSIPTARGWLSLAKSGGLKTRSRRGSRVQIPSLAFLSRTTPRATVLEPMRRRSNAVSAVSETNTRSRPETSGLSTVRCRGFIERLSVYRSPRNGTDRSSCEYARGERSFTSVAPTTYLVVRPHHAAPPFRDPVVDSPLHGTFGGRGNS